MEARGCAPDPARTVVVSGVPDGALPASRIVDKLTIHFQSRRRSDGGDVEHVEYPTNIGVAFITFHHAEDAKKVVKKTPQIMTDSSFLEDYVLTVFPYSDDVFLYVSSATVDLSLLLGDRDSLVENLRSAHRSLRFTPLTQQRKVSVEGPFIAVQALRDDLIRRARYLEPSPQTHSVRIRSATPPISKKMPFWEASEAKRSVVGQNSDTERFSNSDDKLGSQHGFKKFTEDTATQFIGRQVVGESNSDRILSSVFKRNLHVTEDVFTYRRNVDI